MLVNAEESDFTMSISPLKRVIKALLTNISDGKPIIGFDAGEQFRFQPKSSPETLQKLNAAFLLCLCGTDMEGFEEAEGFLRSLSSDGKWKRNASFYVKALKILPQEVKEAAEGCSAFREHLSNASSAAISSPLPRARMLEKVWGVFFPEGVGLIGGRREDKVHELRQERVIKIDKLNPNPIDDPGGQILFTSNILLTTPASEAPDHAGRLMNIPFCPADLLTALRNVIKGPQAYWYDHPVPVDVPPEQNEILHGLQGLDEAVEFEKKRGTVAADTRIPMVLSLSVTHKGLHGLAKPLVEAMLRQRAPLRHLDMYLWTESETNTLAEEILAPAADKYFGVKAGELFREIIGVDGEYGRHFSFLKAITASWKVFYAPQLKATFKIDLDQVFPQENLVKETGASAFEHLMTPLWGAEGTDRQGRPVFLGMIAGALVNQADIRKSLFTPDVPWPEDEISGERWIFHSQLPQALSTRAEMMTRYDGQEGLDGMTRCIQRVHVTGGTCGILAEALRKYRPFTPTFIGRAEDQAYLLSVLFEETLPALRYVHKDGLVMRHDKDLVSPRAVEMAAAGKYVGDLARILLFSYYAEALPWEMEQVKEAVDPFTGCFISRVPFTVATLRLSFKAAELFGGGQEKEAARILEVGIPRLNTLAQWLWQRPGGLAPQWERERDAWNLYYDVVDRIEAGLAQGETLAKRLQQGFERLVEKCRLRPW